MPQAQDIYGTAFKNGSAVLMARIVDAAGDAIVQADIAAIEYSVLLLDECDPDSQTPVAGHDGVSLTVGDVIYDSLQTGGLWTIDTEGYNFRHDIDVGTSEAFPTAGARYQVRYELTPAAGQKIIVRFQLRAL